MRLARARIAREDQKRLAIDPKGRAKTLAELEAQNAKFDQQSPPVASLYSQPRQKQPCSASSGCL